MKSLEFLFIRHGGTELTGHRRLGKTAWIDHKTIWEGPAPLCAPLNKNARAPQNTA